MHRPCMCAYATKIRCTPAPKVKEPFRACPVVSAVGLNMRRSLPSRGLRRGTRGAEDNPTKLGGPGPSAACGPCRSKLIATVDRTFGAKPAGICPSAHGLPRRLGEHPCFLRLKYHKDTDPEGEYGTHGTTGTHARDTGGTCLCPHELGSPGMLLASLGFICMPRGIHYRAQARRMMLRPGIVEGIAMRFVVGDGVHHRERSPRRAPSTVISFSWTAPRAAAT